MRRGPLLNFTLRLHHGCFFLPGAFGELLGGDKQPLDSQALILKLSDMSYFRVFLDRAGEWRWTLHAANGEAVATSEGYTTKWSAQRSVETVKRLAPTAIIRM